jgi:hypothetical protein
MTRERFVNQLGMMLRDVPAGTAADLSDCMVAYWDGDAVVFAFRCERGTGAIDEEFDIDDYVWEEWKPTFANWLSVPAFSSRPELIEWLRDAPPREAGV